MIRIERRQRANDALSCAFTGHRPQKLGYTDADYDNLRRSLRKQLLILVGKNYTHFLSGGAQGFDMIAAEEVLWLKEQLSFITLEMVLPWRGQAERWAEAERARHEKLVSAADMVTVIEENYTQGCLFKRNRFLVDSGDLLLALYKDLPGGTKMTVDYAKSIGREVLILEEL